MFAGSGLLLGYAVLHNVPHPNRGPKLRKIDPESAEVEVEVELER
jgi:hypothetical protein